MEISRLWVYRIIPIDNLAEDLSNGLYSKNYAPDNPSRLSIGHQEIIEERDNRIVKCYTHTVVNDYIPFYFSVRTPMLYNIITGHGVSAKPQEDIIYLCCRYEDLTTNEFQWCFTDGNAAKKITKFFTEHDDLDKLDWNSIKTEDFRADNSDGDEDRIRKKHSEFLVLNRVPPNKIRAIVVLNSTAEARVKSIIKSCNLELNVYLNPEKKFYFL
jgi:hypothetical protein